VIDAGGPAAEPHDQHTTNVDGRHHLHIRRRIDRKAEVRDRVAGARQMVAAVEAVIQ
jgi:hypothetical protein